MSLDFFKVSSILQAVNSAAAAASLTKVSLYFTNSNTEHHLPDSYNPYLGAQAGICDNILQLY